MAVTAIFPFISGLKAVLKHIFGQIQLDISSANFLRHEICQFPNNNDFKI